LASNAISTIWFNPVFVLQGENQEPKYFIEPCLPSKVARPRRGSQGDGISSKEAKAAIDINRTARNLRR
jgi:hypothetical protein